jgi:hypothetical protein
VHFVGTIIVWLGILYKSGGISNGVFLTPFLCMEELHPQSPINLQDKFQCKFYNLTALPQKSSDCSRNAGSLIRAHPPLWLQRHTDLRAEDFAHSRYLCYQPRLAKFTHASSYRLCWINSALAGTTLITHVTMEAAVSSQTSVHVYQIIRHHIPDESNNLTCRIDYG